MPPISVKDRGCPAIHSLASADLFAYVGRVPHEAFFTPDGTEVWVTVRGENYVGVLDGKTFKEKTRIITPAGPGMQIFSPDGKYGYVCSSFNPETDVVLVATHKIMLA